MNSEIDLFWKFVDDVCKKYDVVINEIDTGVAKTEYGGKEYICIDFDLTLQSIHYWDKIYDEINTYKLLLGLNITLFLLK